MRSTLGLPSSAAAPFLLAFLLLITGQPGLAGASDGLFFKALIDDQDIQPSNIQLADFDGDNDLDVVVATERPVDLDGEPVISWWRNDGSGWIETPISSFDLNQHGQVLSLDVGDLDGDGDMDVVAGADRSDSIYWFENSSQGAVWTQHEIAPVSIIPLGIVAADIDDDNDLDLVHSGRKDVTVLAGALQWWENDAGDASSWTSHLIQDTGLGPFGTGTDLSVGDLDKDGEIDIVAGFSSGFSWWENSGGGSLWIQHAIPIGKSPTDTAVVDVNGDTFLDIVGNDTGTGVFWLENNGAATPGFTNRQIDNGFGSYLAIGDFDDDGDVDVVAEDNHDLNLYTSTSAGLSWTETLLEVGFDARGLAAADMDADGDLEIVGTLDSLDHEIAWWDNLTFNDPATFGLQSTIDNELIRQQFAEAVDVNNDGSPDVIGVRGSRMYWIESDGTRHLVDNLRVTDVVGSDVDGDGDTDLFGAGNTTAQVVWWENTSSTGDGTTWTRHTIGGGVAGVFAVAATDLDGDGDADLLAAVSDDDEVVWFENAGAGSAWTEHSVATGFDRPVAVDAADIDGDGHLDVIAAANFEDEIAWFENPAGTGSSSWTEHNVVATFDGASSVVAADVDCDGDLDLVGSAFNGNEVTWWENDGTGSGWNPDIISTTLGVTAVIAADFDRNGSPDLALASLGASEVIYLQNSMGDGSVWGTTVVQSSFAAAGVAAADMDNDGTIDLVGATRSTVAWWSNNR